MDGDENAYHPGCANPGEQQIALPANRRRNRVEPPPVLGRQRLTGRFGRKILPRSAIPVLPTFTGRTGLMVMHIPTLLKAPSATLNAPSRAFITRPATST